MRGQAFSTFKILLGSVFAVVMLGIVYQVVSSYNPPISGMDLLDDLLVQATNAPGECFSRYNAEFNSGATINPDSFYPSSVNDIDSGTPAIECPDSCTVYSKVKIPISAKCEVSGADISCDVFLGSSNCQI